MPKVVIATSTRYRDANEVRAQLAIRFACEASKEGYPLVVVDGGSPEDFLEELKNVGAQLISVNEMSMGASRRLAMEKAFQLAGDDGVVVWSEPEKYPLIADLGYVAAPILDGRVDLVVPQRSEEGMNSYPPEQAAAERIGNLAFKYLTKRSLDVWFGVFAANGVALSYFLGYRGDHGDLWDSIIVPRLTAIKDGIRTMSVPVSYIHPTEQTEQESGNVDFLLKRLAQLQNLVPALQREAEKNDRVSAR